LSSIIYQHICTKCKTRAKLVEHPSIYRQQQRLCSLSLFAPRPLASVIITSSWLINHWYVINSIMKHWIFYNLDIISHIQVSTDNNNDCVHYHSSFYLARNKHTTEDRVAVWVNLASVFVQTFFLICSSFKVAKRFFHRHGRRDRQLVYHSCQVPKYRSGKSWWSSL
jgi:hypothetical protein